MNNEPLHTPIGWNYEKVNACINHIRYILEQQNLSFMENQAVLSWLQSDLSYKLARLAAQNQLELLAQRGAGMLNEPLPDEQMRGYG